MPVSAQKMVLIRIPGHFSKRFYSSDLHDSKQDEQFTNKNNLCVSSPTYTLHTPPISTSWILCLRFSVQRNLA